jgi:hypothetical protein
MTIHNVFTLHASEDGGEGMVSFHRPQDWGNPEEWQHISVSIFVPNSEPRYSSRCCHIWCHPSHERFELLRSAGGLLFSFYFPGRPGELCDRSHLAEDDFWLPEWGKMPPYFDGDDFDPFDDGHAEVDLDLALADPANIPMALTPEYATIVASLMQFSLRNPNVQSQAPQLYQVGRPFVETLIDRIIKKSPEHGDKIRTAFAAGWDDLQDITSEEFDRDWDDIKPKSEPNN